MNDIPIYPSFIFKNRPVYISSEQCGGGVLLHFTDAYGDHIDGYALFDIDDWGLYLEPGIDHDFDEMEFNDRGDCDNDDSIDIDTLKIIGVDIT